MSNAVAPQYFQFENNLIPYDVFLNDVAAKIVAMLKADRNDPEYVSQRKAYDMFGRRNVERWRKEGKVEPCKRPGKMEYQTADLRRLQRVKQDYFV